MQEYFSGYEETSCKKQINTASRLLDGLVMYRADLGDTGKQLEYLLRLGNIRTVLDLPCSERIH